MLNASAKLGSLLRRSKHGESKARVIRSVPRYVAESGQSQRWPVIGRSARVEIVDQGRPNPASCIRGRDADLLDVGAPIDNVAEDVADRVTG